MSKKNSSILWTVDQTGDVIGKDGRETAQKNVGLGSAFVKASKTDKNYVTHVTRESNGELKVNVAQPSMSDLQGLGSTNKNKSIVTDDNGDITSLKLTATKDDQSASNTTVFVSNITEDGQGNVTFTTKTVTTATSSVAGITTLDSEIFTNNTRDESTTCAVTPKGVWTAIDSLDVSDSAVSTKFVTAVSETDGKISVTRDTIKSTDLTWLKAFSTVSDGTNSFDAAAYNSTLNFVSGTAIDPVVDGTNKTVKFNHQDYVSAEGTILPSDVARSGYEIKLPWASYNKQGHITGCGQYIFNVTQPGSGALKFQFGSASVAAVTTGFNANSGSDVTYLFPNAATSAYGVTKLLTYGSTAPANWTTFQTTDDSAVTPKYVYEYVSDSFVPRIWRDMSGSSDYNTLTREGLYAVYDVDPSDSDNDPGFHASHAMLVAACSDVTTGSDPYTAQLAMQHSVRYRYYDGQTWDAWRTLTSMTTSFSSGAGTFYSDVSRINVSTNGGTVTVYYGNDTPVELGYLAKTLPATIYTYSYGGHGQPGTYTAHDDIVFFPDHTGGAVAQFREVQLDKDSPTSMGYLIPNSGDYISSSSTGIITSTADGIPTWTEYKDGIVRTGVRVVTLTSDNVSNDTYTLRLDYTNDPIINVVVKHSAIDDCDAVLTIILDTTNTMFTHKVRLLLDVSDLRQYGGAVRFGYYDESGASWMVYTEFHTQRSGQSASYTPAAHSIGTLRQYDVPADVVSHNSFRSNEFINSAPDSCCETYIYDIMSRKIGSKAIVRITPVAPFVYAFGSFLD